RARRERPRRRAAEQRDELAPFHRCNHSITSSTRHSRNGSYGMSAPSPPQSALMPVNLTTLPHFSVSSAISLPKSAGEPARTVPPRSASRVFMLGSARPALISLLSLSTISTGVFLGAPTPYHVLAS